MAPCDKPRVRHQQFFTRILPAPQSFANSQRIVDCLHKQQRHALARACFELNVGGRTYPPQVHTKRKGKAGLQAAMGRCIVALAAMLVSTIIIATQETIIATGRSAAVPESASTFDQQKKTQSADARNREGWVASPWPYSRSTLGSSTTLEPSNREVSVSGHGVTAFSTKHTYR